MGPGVQAWNSWGSEAQGVQDGEKLAGDGGGKGPRIEQPHENFHSLTWAQQEAAGWGLLARHSGDSNLSLFLMEAWSQNLTEGRILGSIQTPFGSAWPRLAALAARLGCCQFESDAMNPLNSRPNG